MGNELDDLEREYCPPLDAALFHAIISDFNLDDQDALRQAREVLDALRSSAEVEDAAGFDPSGSSNVKDASDLDVAGLSQSDRVSSGTEVTELSAPLSGFNLEDDGHGTYDRGIDSMSIDDKKALLQEMFVDMKTFDIEHVLKKQKGEFGSTVEILLSQKFLAEEPDADGQMHSIPKGIEGFVGTSTSGRARKVKTKKRKDVTPLNSREMLVEGPSSSGNRWQKAKDDVDFIAERTNLSSPTVTSIYNTSGHSLRATIASICKKHPINDLACTTDAEDPLVQSNIVDLSAEYPSVPLSYITTLVLLTHPLMASARELAAALASPTRDTIVPQYIATIPSTSRSDDPNPVSDTFTSSSGLSPPALPVNGAYDTLRASAFAQASAAYRRSRSNPLMGGAAAHYASVGHAANVAMKRARAAEADARVAAQSVPGGSSSCDLHGVTVTDAGRIAKSYVMWWWEGRREWARRGTARAGGGGVEGMGGDVFRIVVGRGAHSAEGKGKLGPAVAKVLRADGWRVEEQVGELLVKGRARK